MSASAAAPAASSVSGGSTLGGPGGAQKQQRVRPACTYTGHRNQRNFVGLSVSPDGHILCGSEDNSGESAAAWAAGRRRGGSCCGGRALVVSAAAARPTLHPLLTRPPSPVCLLVSALQSMPTTARCPSAPRSTALVPPRVGPPARATSRSCQRSAGPTAAGTAWRPTARACCRSCSWSSRGRCSGLPGRTCLPFHIPRVPRAYRPASKHIARSHTSLLSSSSDHTREEPHPARRLLRALTFGCSLAAPRALPCTPHASALLSRLCLSIVAPCPIPLPDCCLCLARFWAGALPPPSHPHPLIPPPYSTRYHQDHNSRPCSFLPPCHPLPPPLHPCIFYAPHRPGRSGPCLN